MAAYTELFNLFGDSTLRNRIEVACIVAAETIRNEASPTAPRLAWARSAFENSKAIRDRMLKALLAANKDETVAAIQGVDDPALQTLVDAAVDLFAGE